MVFSKDHFLTGISIQKTKNRQKYFLILSPCLCDSPIIQKSYGLAQFFQKFSKIFGV